MPRPPSELSRRRVGPDRVESLTAELRRLREMVDLYRDFGFDPLIPEYKGRIAALLRKIRALENAAAENDQPLPSSSHQS